jgi:formyl-CoA transferase
MTHPPFIRVLDLTDEAVAYGTRLLANLGAHVVRIVSPGAGMGAGSADRAFQAGKRCVAADLRRPEGLDALARWCAETDVVVDGIDPVADGPRAFHRCLASNPRLVWVMVRPCAPDAEGARDSSAEIVRYALSGLMSITGLPGQSPSLLGGGLSNAVVAGYAALAALLGARQARRTGVGCLVTVSAHEALVSVMQQGVLEAAMSGRVVTRGGNRHAHIAMAGALPCRDGFVVISANERTMWRALVEMVGDDRLRDEALNDERVRMQRQAELFQTLEGWTRRFTKAELSEMAQARHIPIAPVHGVGDLIRDPHLRTRGFFQRIEGVGELPVLRTPWSAPADEAARA